MAQISLAEALVLFRKMTTEQVSYLLVIASLERQRPAHSPIACAHVVRELEDVADIRIHRDFYEQFNRLVEHGVIEMPKVDGKNDCRTTDYGRAFLDALGFDHAVSRICEVIEEE